MGVNVHHHHHQQQHGSGSEFKYFMGSDKNKKGERIENTFYCISQPSQQHTKIIKKNNRDKIQLR